MNRARQVLVVAMMATALCADRAATPAPIDLAGGRQTGELAELAGRLVGRLAAGFVRARVSVAASMERRDGRPATVAGFEPRAANRLDLPRTDCRSPFQFRLPPPRRC